MRKRSLIIVLAIAATVGCGTKEKGSLAPNKDGSTCSAGFAQAYMSTDQKVKATYQSEENESADKGNARAAEATEACTSFKSSYANMSCNALDENGDLVEFLASDIIQDCETFSQSLVNTPSEASTPAVSTEDLVVQE